ncbi:MAG: biosynthetic arginine decarboxylase [Zetaproteobacteria bacterium]|nr:MAG: biosynthetic arginine decarboxylase [Zetaproteobacteria bacterium]
MTRASSWNIERAAALYRLEGWGNGFFAINADGHLQALPDGRRAIDLARLVEELKAQGLSAPLLIRFSDILRTRMAQIHQRFEHARREAGYQGRYFGVYPIKVNQQRQVVEEIVEFGAAYNWGLEAGSKPELHATLAMLEDVEGLIICNGYKDREFIELALMGRKMGKRVYIVVEKPNELGLILTLAERLGVEPLIGLRCRLTTNGQGLWRDSAGDGSKFGLSALELTDAVTRLREAGYLGCLRLLHFHIGSQVPQIRYIKAAMQEAARFYVELRRMGAPIEVMDVGGGLGVNYDGSISSTATSVDYSLQEYANDIVWTLKDVCDEARLPQPDIVSESGRALVAHHAVLIINVLGVSQRLAGRTPQAPDAEAPLQLRQLWQTWQDLEEMEPREALHDVLALREDLHRLFTLGHCSLVHRAQGDVLYWHLLSKLRQRLDIEEAETLVPGIHRQMADRYFLNFSLFQSLPDAWGIGQVFPVMPIQRLHERPETEAILVDVTCDSDGKIERFPLAGGSEPTLPLHRLREGEEYYLGIFLTGAYQEILGDLHNLFGDTHAVHVRLDEDGYELEQVVAGESVAEVLDYVQFHEDVLSDRWRRQLNRARDCGRLNAREVTAFLRFYREGLRGYTYLED